MNRVTIVSAALASLFWMSAASAQTANSSPTSPAPSGLPGTPPSSSATGPSGGTPGAAARQGSASAGETEIERKEEAHQDKVMNICKGC